MSEHASAVASPPAASWVGSPPAQDEWSPHEGPQWAFLETDADEVLYGGAAGGGKSDALLIEALRDVDHPGYRAVLFRRTYPELAMSLIDRSRTLYQGKGTYNESAHSWIFPSGARITFAHIQRETDAHRYQSAAFAFIGFDELTSFTQYQYEYMLSRNRNTVGLFNRVRAATNPGGIGHAWVKARFIDRLPPYTVKHFVRKGMNDVEVAEGTEFARSRQFIPAKVSDNPSLTTADPQYIARLMALPERDMQMLLEGRWDVAYEGLVYVDFNSMIHVIDGFEPPKNEGMRFRSIDFGWNNPFVAQWWWLNGDDELHLYREIYQSHRLVSDLGPEINRLSEGEQITGTVADHDAENRAELEVKHGIVSAPATKAITEGISAVARRMRIGDNGRPRIFFHRGCTIGIDRRMLADGRPTSTVEEIQVYQYPSPKEGRSPDEKPLDLDNHGMDAMRYVVMLVELLRTGRHRSRSQDGL